VIQKALRQAALALVTLSATALVLSAGVVGSTSAVFNGETQNAGSTFAGGWIDPPTSLTATASGYTVNLGWTAGTHGPVTGQQLNGVDNSTNANCIGAVLGPVTTLGAAATAYADSAEGSLATDGDWFCYQLVSTSASSWTAQATQQLQLGLVTTRIAIANVGTSGTINANDTITLTFNQQTNLAASGTTKVCVVSPGTIIIGDTAGGNSCASNNGYTVGTITGVTIGGNQVYRNSTFTTTSVSPYTMTITLVGGGTTTYSGTATFTPSATLKSAATLNQATMCTTSASTCRPTTTTQF